jgi:nucleoid-associated protein YgaU
MLVLLVALSTFSYAQKYTKDNVDNYEQILASLQERQAQLSREVTSLQNDIKSLNDQNASLQSFEDCMDELYALVGATKADVDNFRNQVGELNGKINRKEGPKADRQTELNALKANKISALPEFFDRVHNQMQRAMDAWQEAPQEVQYTVVKGDCLWNIAKKKEHYANAFAWPKIYQANRDQIKNPDLIYPKQTFKIPNLTQEEKSRYETLRKNYKPAPPTQTAQ